MTGIVQTLCATMLGFLVMTAWQMQRHPPRCDAPHMILGRTQ